MRNWDFSYWVFCSCEITREILVTGVKFNLKNSGKASCNKLKIGILLRNARFNEFFNGKNILFWFFIRLAASQSRRIMGWCSGTRQGSLYLIYIVQE